MTIFNNRIRVINLETKIDTLQAKLHSAQADVCRYKKEVEKLSHIADLALSDTKALRDSLADVYAYMFLPDAARKEIKALVDKHKQPLYTNNELNWQRTLCQRENRNRKSVFCKREAGHQGVHRYK
jgi:hypothetical protein